MKYLLEQLALWYVDLPWGGALALAMGIFLGVAALTWGYCAYTDPLAVEMRAIKRKRRRERRIVISARELAKHRQDIDVRVSRGFLKAMRECK